MYGINSATIGVLLTTDESPATADVKLSRNNLGLLIFLKRPSNNPSKLKCSFSDAVIKMSKKIVMMELFARCPISSGKGIIPKTVKLKTTKVKTAVGLKRLINSPAIIIAMATISTMRVASGANNLWQVYRQRKELI